MCFGGSKSDTSIPPPNPPTSFDYKAGIRGDTQQKQVQQSAAAATAPTSFGSELGNASAVEQ